VAPLAPNIPFVTIAFRDHRRGRMPLFACRCRQMSSMSLWDVAKEQMEFVIITARVQTQRIMTVLVEIGTRLPAHATSMGRVLLADLPPAACPPSACRRSSSRPCCRPPPWWTSTP
jgi:DNA-binding IclR family transcriptional regulator